MTAIAQPYSLDICKLDLSEITLTVPSLLPTG